MLIDNYFLVSSQVLDHVHLASGQDTWGLFYLSMFFKHSGMNTGYFQVKLILEYYI